MRRRVLMVTNAFPPAMLADMQRARLLSYCLQELGWDVEVLVPGLQFQRSVWIEPDSLALRPTGVPIHEVLPWMSSIFAAFKMRSVGWRALVPLYRAGCALLRQSRFDLVYISTAQFVFFLLGRLWTRRFQMPYVLDFHDPWYKDRHHYVTTQHRFKSLVAKAASKTLEGFALRHASGLVSVSPTYLRQLATRYPGHECLLPERTAVIPFGATQRDFAQIERNSDSTKSGHLRIVYVGVGGDIMAKSFARILEALCAATKGRAQLRARLRICLYGTDLGWRPGLPRHLQEVAARMGLAGAVAEEPDRMSYAKAMQTVSDADGLLILGVDDEGYMPSKLFTYALSGKPLLCCLRPDSAASGILCSNPAIGHLLTFGPSDAKTDAEATAIMLEFLREVETGKTFDRRSILEPWLASAMARQHAELFERCLASCS